MKKRNCALLALFTSILFVAAILLGTGCEATSPSEMTVSVTPDYAKLKSGQSVTLTASGWNAYKWSLQNSEYGYLSSTVGERVTYRAIKGLDAITKAADKDAALKQIITVSAVGSKGTTNSSAIASGQVTILQQ